MSNDVQVEVDQFKITVSYSAKQWRTEGGHDEVYAAVQQSIPDAATPEQIDAFITKLADPIKAAVQKALPEQAAPLLARQSAPRQGGGQSGKPVQIVAWSPRDNQYVPVEDSAVAGLFKEEGDTSWVIPTALAENEGVREVHFAQKKDKSGTYFRAKGANGWLGYVNKPEGTSAPDLGEEPF